jgi:hypothetical protein
VKKHSNPNWLKKNRIIRVAKSGATREVALNGGRSGTKEEYYKLAYNISVAINTMYKWVDDKMPNEIIKPVAKHIKAKNPNDFKKKIIQTQLYTSDIKETARLLQMKYNKIYPEYSSTPEYQEFLAKREAEKIEKFINNDSIIIGANEKIDIPDGNYEVYLIVQPNEDFIDTPEYEEWKRVYIEDEYYVAGKDMLSVVNNEYSSDIKEVLMQKYTSGGSINIISLYKTIFNTDQEPTVFFVFAPIEEVIPNPMDQVYKYSKHNECVFKAILRKFPYLKNHKSFNTTKYRYPQGVPESELNYIADTFGITISLYNPLGDLKTKISPQDGFNKDLYLKIINISPNHVINYNSSVNWVTEDKLKSMSHLYNLKIFSKSTLKGVINSLGVFKIGDMDDRIDRFNKEINIQDYKIPISSDTDELVDFIRQGYYMFPKQIIKQGDSIEIDEVKAFTQSRNSPYYEGFPVNPCHMKETDRIVGVGYYQCYIEPPKDHLFIKIGWEASERILPSPMIKYLRHNNYKVTISKGAWSFANFHFDFPDYMLTGDKPEPYKLWCGMIGATENHTKYKLKGNLEWAQHLKHLYNDCWYNDEEIMVRPHRYHKTTGVHIAGFITMYSHMRLCEQLKLVNFDDVMSVEADAVHINPEVKYINLYKNFRIKRVINTCDDDETFKMVKFQQEIKDYKTYKGVDSNARVIHFNGGGGSGKSQYAMENFPNPFFVTISNLLVQDKTTTTKYGKNGMNLACMKNDAIRRFRNSINYQPAVIVFDETPLYTSMVKNIIKAFPLSILIFIADIDEEGCSYQLGENKKLKLRDQVEDWIMLTLGKTKEEKKKIKAKLEKKKEGVIQSDNNQKTFGGGEYVFPLKLMEYTKVFTEDYRCKCDKLKDLKENLRGQYRWKPEEVYNSLRQITEEELIKEYNVKDYVLASTRKRVNHFTAILSGEKYRVMKNNDKYCNGDILFEWPDNTVCERRHAFTVHSVQGKTIRDRIYIDIDEMFDPKIFYVAVSRAEKIDQICIVKSPEVIHREREKEIIRNRFAQLRNLPSIKINPNAKKSDVKKSDGKPNISQMVLPNTRKRPNTRNKPNKPNKPNAKPNKPNTRKSNTRKPNTSQMVLRKKSDN